MTVPTFDRQGRRRNVTVAFRVSHAEAERIDAAVSMSGLTKQDYILSRLLQKEIRVVPSTRVQQALREQMNAVYRELRRIQKASEEDADLGDTIDMLARIFVGLGEDGPSDVESEDALINGLQRA